MADPANSTPAPAPKTRRSALGFLASAPAAAALGFIVGRAIIDTDFSPASYIRQIRALGHAIYVLGDTEDGYSIDFKDGASGAFPDLAMRFGPTMKSDPTYKDRVFALLKAERA